MHKPIPTPPTQKPALPPAVADVLYMAGRLETIARELGRVQVPGATDPQRTALTNASADVARAALSVTQAFGGGSR